MQAQARLALAQAFGSPHFLGAKQGESVGRKAALRRRNPLEAGSLVMIRGINGRDTWSGYYRVLRQASGGRVVVEDRDGKPQAYPTERVRPANVPRDTVAIGDGVAERLRRLDRDRMAQAEAQQRYHDQQRRWQHGREIGDEETSSGVDHFADNSDEGSQ